jgi:hypothetical protein
VGELVLERLRRGRRLDVVCDLLRLIGEMLNAVRHLDARDTSEVAGPAVAASAREPMLDQVRGLGDPHPLDRSRHHDPGKARLRLADRHRVARFAGAAQLVGELWQSRLEAGGARVRSEPRAEVRIDQQPLDQLGGALRLLVSG